MNNKARWLAFIAALALMACLGLCAVAGISLRYGNNILAWIEQQNALKVGAAAPDFSLRSLDGSDTRLSQYRGQPVLLTFAASWCPACREEAPYQQALHTRHPELVMLLVDNNETDSAVRGFADDFGMSFPILLDASGGVYLQYRVFSIPTTFFIDAEGIIRHIQVGGLTSDLMSEKLPLVGVAP